LNEPLPPLDKRVHHRRTLRVAARVVVAGATEVEVRTSDISEGGLGVVAAVNPSIGARFRVRFGLPSGAPEPILIDAQVTVVRSILARDEGGFKIGLLFAPLDESSLDAVRKYISRG
jgi:hypothetical protein